MGNCSLAEVVALGLDGLHCYEGEMMVSRKSIGPDRLETGRSVLSTYKIRVVPIEP